MIQPLHSTRTLSTSRKHIVPTHLNLPDAVLTAGSISLSARQFLLLLVGGGLGGTAWQHLAALGHHALAGQMLRFLLASVPLLLLLVLACYQYAGRFLEVWLLVLLRSHLRPKRYLWRSIRADAHHLSPLLPSHHDLQEREAQQRVPLLKGEKP